MTKQRLNNTRSTDCNLKVYLICLHYNKNVVNPNGQHKEGDDLDHDEREGYTGIAEDPQ